MKHIMFTTSSILLASMAHMAFADVTIDFFSKSSDAFGFVRYDDGVPFEGQLSFTDSDNESSGMFSGSNPSTSAGVNHQDMPTIMASASSLNNSTLNLVGGGFSLNTSFTASANTATPSGLNSDTANQNLDGSVSNGRAMD